MSQLSKILVLISFTVFLTITLLGFALFNVDKLQNQIEGKIDEGVGFCGTVSLDNNGLVDSDPFAKTGEMLFRRNCMACHRLDQKLVGPALRHVYSARDSIWLRQMITDGYELVKKRDKVALALFEEYNQIQHVKFTGFEEEDVTRLMYYLRAVAGIE